MNSGKKVAKGETKPVKQINNRGDEPVSTKSKIVIGIVAVLAVFMIGYIVWENHHPQYLVSINGEKAKIEDMMYDVYETESVYGYMANFYAQLGYGDYWTMEAGENGETVQELAREECMDSYIEGTILYQEAVENGYEVTEEDKEEADRVLQSIIQEYTVTEDADASDETSEDAEEAADGTTEEDAASGQTEEALEPTEVLGFSVDELRTLLEEREVAARYREDMVAAYGITEADVVDSVDKDEFRQYDIEYFTISLDGEEEEDGGVAEVTGAEKEARYEKIKAVLEEAGSKDWSTVISTEDTDSDSEEVKVEYDSDGFIISESYFDEETTAMITAMKNGEVSDIIESEGSYYVIKMVNNNSTERYESEIEDAIDAAERERFEEDYEVIKAKYDIKIYEGDWNKVQLGSLTA